MTDPSFMADLHRTEIFSVSAVVLLIALLAAGIAAAANRKWPKRSFLRIATFTVLVLAIGFFALTVGLMFWLMSAPCSDNSACDAGAMAAAGIIMFGAIELVVAVLVGGPVAYFTVGAIRRR